MKCTHCNQELTSFRKSTTIARNNNSSDKKHFIMCKCGNVMIATFNEENEILTLEPTPETDTPETREMMRQAAELFNLNSHMFYVQKVSSTSPQESINHAPALYQKSESPCEYYHDHTCDKNNAPAAKKQNPIKNLFIKIVNLFKR